MHVREGGWRGTVLYENDCYTSDEHSPCIMFPFVPALLSLYVTHAVLCARRLLLSGDVEENQGPGPEDENLQEVNITTSDDGTIPSAVAKEILAAIHLQSQQQKEQNAAIRDDLSDIKNELSKVKQQCESINKRCDSLEEEQEKLAAAVGGLTNHVEDLSADSTRTREETREMAQTVQSLRQELETMGEEVDRLEAFSRRDNLRLFGIPQVGDTESYSQCASAVVSVLNSVEGSKTWTDRDIVRAHRIGQARQGEPSPVIAKFQNWTDKMTLLTDKDYRGKLESRGTRVANDLTHRQASLAAQARRDGKSVFFVKGRLTVGARRPDPEATAGTQTATTTASTSTALTRTEAATSTGHRPAGRVAETSVLGNQSTPTQVGNSPRRVHGNVAPSQQQQH